MSSQRVLNRSPLSPDTFNRPLLSQSTARVASPFALVSIEEPDQPAPVLLTIAEVAAALRMSEKSVRRRIKDGTIRKASLGGRAVRISPDELRRVTAGTPLEEVSEDPDIAQY
jgi:excisionase family DNA binding protein